MMIQGAGLERKTAGWVKISGDRAHVGIWKKKTTRGRRKAWLERLVENEAAVPEGRKGEGTEGARDCPGDAPGGRV